MSEKLYQAVKSGQIRVQDLNEEGKKALKNYLLAKQGASSVSVGMGDLRALDRIEPAEAVVQALKTHSGETQQIPGEGSPEVKALAEKLFIDAPQGTTALPQETAAAPQDSWYTSLDRKLGGLLPFGAAVPAPEGVNPEFAANHPVANAALEALTRPVRAAFSSPWVERPAQTANENRYMTENPDKVSTGSKAGDIITDLIGTAIGLAVPGSVGGGFIKGTVGLAEKLLPRISNRAADLAVKGAAASIPYDVAFGALNDDIDPRSVAINALASAGLNVLPYGVGRVLANRADSRFIPNAAGVERKLEDMADKIDPGTVQQDLSEPSGGLRAKSYRLPNAEQAAMDRLTEGILKAQDYIRHNDVLAPYPAGTTVDKAFADIKKNTGVDLPALAEAAEKAANAPKLGAQLREGAKYTRLGQAAGAIPEVKGLRRGNVVREVAAPSELKMNAARKVLGTTENPTLAAKIFEEFPQLKSEFPEQAGWAEKAGKDNAVDGVQKYVKTIDQDKVNAFVDNAMKLPEKFKTLPLREVTPEEAATIKKLIGVDTTGYTHELSNQGLWHAIKTHGDELTEAKRGQLPLTASDLKTIPEVISNPDSILPGDIKGGTKRLVYQKRINGFVYYVEEVLSGKGTLRAKTMWKKPSAMDSAAQDAPLFRTSETDSGITSSNSSINSGEAAVNSREIQQARESVKDMDALFKAEEKPDGPTMLYSGIPAEKVAESVNVAGKKLADKLGVPEEGIVITQRPESKQPGLRSQLKSPSAVARKYPAAKPYVDDGIKAIEIQERLRRVFNKRLDAVDKVLAGGKSWVQDPLRRTYKQNKTDLHEILLTGDMMGKRFTEAELRSEFDANDYVIRGYRLIRSAYDHAYTISSKVRELRGKDPVNYREGYIPHFFHSWFIVANGKIAGSTRTMREAVEMSNPLARKGVAIEIRPKQFEFPGADVQAAVLGDLNYFKLKGKIEKDFGISREDAESLLNGVARMKGRSRFVGNFMERKGVAGWEKNLDWVNRHYFNMVSRYAAMDRFKSQAVTRFERTFGSFDKEHTGIAKYIKDYINDVNGVPTQVENLLNNALAKVPALSQFLGKHLGDRPALQLASMTTNAVAIAKLGMYNVSSALVNATQLINTYAKLGEKWTAKGLLKAAHLSARDKGILKQIGVDVQLGLESGAGYSKAAQMGRLFRGSTLAFQAVEKKLRSTAGLGAYYKGLEEGMNHKAAIEYAKKTVDLTNFNYSVADTPGFIRRSGPVGQVLFQFKKYPIKTLEFMTQLKGAEHARFWVPLVLIGGYYAFPGMETLKNIANGLFGVDIELETKEYLMNWAGKDKERQAAAKTILYGAFGMAGADISKRVGMGDFIPSQVDDLFGPTVSTVVRAAQLAGRNEWVETLRAISPAPGNLLLALQNDGEISDPWNRDRLKVKLGPGEQALKAVGFTPTRESIERDKTRVINYAEEKKKSEEQGAIDEYISAKQAKDSARTAKAVKKLTELKITPDRVKEEMEKKGTLPSRRTLENVPKKRQNEYKGISQFQ